MRRHRRKDTSAARKPKAPQIPVVMDTNDRGMLDIERYDLTRIT